MSTREPDLAAGLYEAVVTQELTDKLLSLSELEVSTNGIDDADLPHVLSRHVAAALESVLQGTRGTDQRLAVVNAVLDKLNRTSEGVVTPPAQRAAAGASQRPGDRVCVPRRPTRNPAGRRRAADQHPR